METNINSIERKENAIIAKECLSVENHIIDFLESRLKIFKRADCDLMAELISIKINVPVETVSETVENFIATQKKIIVKNSSYFLNNSFKE